MSPIPELIRADIFSNLEGSQLVRAVNACAALIEVPSKITSPPNRQLIAEYQSSGFPPQTIQVGLDQALLIKGDPLLTFMQTTTEENGVIVPVHHEQIHNVNFNLLNGFGVYLHFDKDRQILSVGSLNRNINTEIPLAHGGLKNDFSSETRITIAALATLPESLWSAAGQKGIITGMLKNDPYDDWRLHTWSLMINDQKGLFFPKKSHPTLIAISPDEIGRRLEDTRDPETKQQMENYLNNLGLVGVLSY